MRNTYIRPMTMADLPIVLEIEIAAYPFPWRLQTFQDCLKAGYHADVLEINQTIIGYGLMLKVMDEAQILNICIHPTQQGYGYGRKMLEHLLQFAQLTKSVFLEVRPSNIAALKLYKNMGFKQVGIRKKYYPNGNQEREDALILRKTLISS
jgi:ribosomal-protein-alanine N-acetyltransferase